jgi:hypothetical protein
MARPLDQKNRDADRVNPEHSGIRTGNPQLDPESARKPAEAPPKDKPHAPPAPGEQ